MKHHIIYIPGINDHHSYGQNTVINLFWVFGFVPHYFPLGWNKKENFEVKLVRLLAKIEELQKDGGIVSLIGVSAGASAALNAYAKSPEIAGVVCISGKINHPETVWPQTHKANPDFKKSMDGVKNSLDNLNEVELSRIMSIHPLKDSVVPIEDTIIDGAVEKTVPGWGHVSGIFFGVVFGALAIAQFLRAATPKNS